MYRGCSVLWAAALATLALVPVGLARRTGTDSGFSGGPVNGGANCTECHGYNEGLGRVELLGAPRRYLPGAAYDLTVRITDADQVGAGFEISAEAPAGHVGTISVIDATNTQFTDFGFNRDYVTHTITGVDDSVVNWPGNGQSVEYNVRWEAPPSDVGAITLFVGANAINDDLEQSGDHYYHTYQTMAFAEAGDADGDADRDLADVASLGNCVGVSIASANDPCAFVDADGDGVVSLADWLAVVAIFDGPTATLPADYLLADPVRGGLLYDKWWKVNGAAEPTGVHPIYPDVGVRTGSVTFRCKECHGWDYKGVDGAYATGIHFTGIVGVFDTQLSPRELFGLLKADPNEVPDGHDMDAHGMGDQDIWNVVKFTLETVINTDNHIDDTGEFVGDPMFGGFAYASVCMSCHGEFGDGINFGTEAAPEYIGTHANEDPWKFLHKTRFGHPGSPMPSGVLLGWSATTATNVGTYCQTLPTE